MRYNRIAALAAAAVLSLSMTACAGGNDTPATETTAASAAPAVTMQTEPAVPTEPFDLDAPITDAMYSRAVLNEGNKARLAKAMRKAMNGEPITVGVIGGSITQGSLAQDHNNCYAERFHQYWTEKFPQSEITFVNAGIGGTSSYLGVHRVDEQLLAYEPDVVIVEFSVNDTDKVVNKYSYDSLVRKILNSEKEPAVMLLFTTQENGTSLVEIHSQIGAAYDLPMLSYREIVYPEVSAGTLNWKDISPDNIHPNDVGHGIIGQLLSRYLDSVYDDIDSISEDTSFDIQPYTSDYYKDGRMYGLSELTITEVSGFEACGNSVYPDLFPDNMKTTEEGYLSFEVECSCLGFFYLKQTGGNPGKYDVFVDGERRCSLDANFKGGWGTYGETQQALLSKEPELHKIEIKPAEGSADTELTILGVMISK